MLVAMRTALLFVAVVAAGVAIGVGLKQASESEPTTLASRAIHPSAAEVDAALGGAPAPIAALHDRAGQILPGGTKRLRAELAALRGHPVVVNAWASWCGPCNVEAPVFQRVALKRGRSVAFLGLNAKDNRAAAHRFLRRYPMTYPSVEDPKGSAYESLKAGYLPSTVFIDAAGKVRIVHSGQYTKDADLEADIDRYAVGRGR